MSSQAGFQRFVGLITPHLGAPYFISLYDVCCLPAGTVRVLVATEIWPGLQLSLVEEGEELGDLL